MNAGLFFTALALLGGVALAVQSPTNALVARATGSPIAAALVSFAVGGVALAAVLLASGGAKFGPDARALPAHAWLGGLYGAFFVAVAALAAPRIGVSALLTAAIAGQIVAALLLDHFGLLGLPRHPLSATRGGRGGGDRGRVAGPARISDANRLSTVGGVRGRGVRPARPPRRLRPYRRAHAPHRAGAVGRGAVPPRRPRAMVSAAGVAAARGREAG